MASSARRVAFLAATSASLAIAGNPVIPNVGMADPHVHAFGGHFYMYSTHDFSPNNTNFLMRDWRVWASSDLVNWELASTLYPNQTAASPAEQDECWATDAAVSPDGSSYYFYLSMGPDEIGVVNGSSPVGPWSDPLHVPLINASLGPSLNPPTQSRDPCVFFDAASNAHYIIFGVFNYYIARLAPDLVSLAEAPRFITVYNQMGQYGPGKMDDKPFVHVGPNGLFYLSWGCFYATAASVYGPYTYVGSVIDTAALAPAFRMNSTVQPGKWWTSEDYADRHGSFWAVGGQWYYAANDRSHSSDKAYPQYYRDTVIGYVHYYANGTIAPVVIDATGVGQYDASGGAARPIEAENFFSLGSGGGLRGPYKGHDASGRFGVHGITARTTITYPHMRNVPANATTLVLRGANARADGAATRVVVRLGSAGDGPVACTAQLPHTGHWERYTEAPCEWHGSAAQAGVEEGSNLTLVLTFPQENEDAADADAELLRLDALWFAQA